jgi:hypothetical protein
MRMMGKIINILFDIVKYIVILWLMYVIVMMFLGTFELVET